MHKLTKGEAIRRHRLMWNYIADESDRTRTHIDKDDAFNHFGWKETPFNRCWCCAYAYQKCIKLITDDTCDYCPLDWERGNSVTHCYDCNVDIDGVLRSSLYIEWYSIKILDDCNSGLLDEYIDLAKRIANLPEKED